MKKKLGSSLSIKLTTQILSMSTANGGFCKLYHLFSETVLHILLLELASHLFTLIGGKVIIF